MIIGSLSSALQFYFSPNIYQLCLSKLTLKIEIFSTVWQQWAFWIGYSQSK